MKNLPKKIYDLESFQKEFRILEKKSVRSLFPKIQREADNLFSVIDVIDWNYLLSCASILSQSEESKHQDAALRIAQSCLEETDTEENQKAGASIILHKLTNKPALDLAIEKELLSEELLSKIPLPFLIEQTKRDVEHIVFTSNNKRIYLNRFQKVFYEKAYLFDYISASAPTSSGKSFILNLFVLEQLRKKDAVKIVYIVPTRALITQVERDLSRALSENNPHDVYVSSMPQWPEDIKKDRSSLLVFTQERLHWFLNDQPGFKIDFLIVDEAQKIGDGGRGVLLQQKIEELVSRLPNLRILFCSASTENPEILLEGLEPNSSTQVVAVDYVAVNQNLIRVSKAPKKPREWNIDFCLKDSLIPLGKIALGDILIPGQRLPTFAFYLGSKDGGNMIYVNGQAEAEKTALSLYELVGENSIIKDEDIKNFIDLTKKIIHPKYSLSKVLKRGIAFHYGNMPLIIKDEIEKLFSVGKIKYLVCTSTLLEGVNLPAKSIFI